MGVQYTEHGEKIKTITFDNGTEFHGYKQIEEQFPVISYFATPYHSWERGSNENTNGLIRQYIPKSACVKNITQADCTRIAHALNTRPRKRYCYKTPYELYYDQEPSLHFTLEAEFPNNDALEITASVEFVVSLLHKIDGLNTLVDVLRKLNEEEFSFDEKDFYILITQLETYNIIKKKEDELIIKKTLL